jgi:hypothetical protein
MQLCLNSHLKREMISSLHVHKDGNYIIPIHPITFSRYANTSWGLSLQKPSISAHELLEGRSSFIQLQPVSLSSSPKNLPAMTNSKKATGSSWTFAAVIDPAHHTLSPGRPIHAQSSGASSNCITDTHSASPTCVKACRLILWSNYTYTQPRAAK